MASADQLPTQGVSLNPSDEKRASRDSTNSTEDKVKENVEMVLDILRSHESSLYQNALYRIREMLRGSESSKTLSAIPRHLVLLKPYYEFFKNFYHELTEERSKRLVADILSMLSTVQGHLVREARETLKYRLLGNTDLALDFWGHEYTDHLSDDVVAEVKALGLQSSSPEAIPTDLMTVIQAIISYNLKANCVTEAVDFCLETGRLDFLERALGLITGDLAEFIGKIGYYAVSCSGYLTEPEQSTLKRFASKLYRKYGFYIEAMVLALQADPAIPLGVDSIIRECQDQSTRKQMAAILAGHRLFLHDIVDPELRILMSTRKTAELFAFTAKELDLLRPVDIRPMLPEQLLATPLLLLRAFGPGFKSQRSSTRVTVLHAANGFINAGFGTDYLVTSMRPETLVAKYSETAISGTVASLGLIHLWNTGATLENLEALRARPEPEFSAGALLAAAISRCGVRGEEEFDDFLDAPEFDSIGNGTWDERVCAVIGLGVAFSGTHNPEPIFLLKRLIKSDRIPIILKGLTGLSIALICPGSGRTKIALVLCKILAEIDVLVKRSEELVTCWFLSLAIGLIFLHKQIETGPVLVALKSLQTKRLRSMAKIIFKSCTFAATGNVLKIQELLHVITRDPKQQRRKSNYKPRTHRSKSRSRQGAASISSTKVEPPTPAVKSDQPFPPIDESQKKKPQKSILKKENKPKTTKSKKSKGHRRRTKFVESTKKSVDSENKLDSKSEPVSISKSEPVSISKSEPDSEPKTEPNSIPKAESISTTKSETESKSSSIGSLSTAAPPIPRRARRRKASSQPKASPIRKKLEYLNEFHSMSEIRGQFRKVDDFDRLRALRGARPGLSKSSRIPGLIGKGKFRTSRYSLGRRASLPAFGPRDKPTNPTNDDIFESVIESDVELGIGPTRKVDPYDISGGPARSHSFDQALSLMESLEAITRSLERILSQQDDGKRDVSSISRTPPRYMDKAVATLGLGLVALGEDIGENMSRRVVNQILTCADPSARRMAPLALGLICLSNPDPEVMLTLERYSRYQTASLSANSIIASGLAGAGSLDGRLNRTLNSLSAYYDSGPALCMDALIMAQGLLHLGKGLMTINPFSYDRQLLSPTSLAASAIIAFACLDVRNTLLGRLHHMIYYLVPAVRPRFVVTLDENSLQPVEVPLKVGRSVDSISQVGKPRVLTVTSTQNSPIVLAPQEKSEIGNDKYAAIGKIIEGIVIVKKTD